LHRKRALRLPHAEDSLRIAVERKGWDATRAATNTEGCTLQAIANSVKRQLCRRSEGELELAQKRKRMV